MTGPAHALYLPYGAYELKAKYQFNLLLGMLITLSTVGLLLAGAWMYSHLTANEVMAPPPKVPVVTVRDIPPPPLVIPETPDIATGEALAALPEYFIPEPVPDEAIIDEDVVLATRDEKIDIVNRGLDDIIGTGGGFVIDENAIAEVVPPVDSFIPLEIQAEMIYRHVPEYPRLARIAGIEGVVWVAAWVSEEGKVLDAIVYKSSGTAALDEAAVEAAYKNVFKPGIQNGRPVSCWVRYRVAFELDH